MLKPTISFSDHPIFSQPNHSKARTHNKMHTKNRTTKGMISKLDKSNGASELDKYEGVEFDSLLLLLLVVVWSFLRMSGRV